MTRRRSRLRSTTTETRLEPARRVARARPPDMIHRAISLIVLPLMKCSRRIRAIVSTTSIPDHLLHSQSRQRNSPTYRGSILDADPPA